MDALKIIHHYLKEHHPRTRINLIVTAIYITPISHLHLPNTNRFRIRITAEPNITIRRFVGESYTYTTLDITDPHSLPELSKIIEDHWSRKSHFIQSIWVKNNSAVIRFPHWKQIKPKHHDECFSWCVSQEMTQVRSHRLKPIKVLFHRLKPIRSGLTVLNPSRFYFTVLNPSRFYFTVLNPSRFYFTVLNPSGPVPPS